MIDSGAGEKPDRAPRRALALVGFMASGKSTVGSLVALRAGAPHHDLDAMIEDRSGMTISELFERSGEVAFRTLESELLPAALEPGAVASLGGGAALRDENWTLIRKQAVSVWLDVPLSELIARAGEKLDRPLLRGLGQQGLRTLLEARLERYRQADYRVDASRPLDVVADEVCRLWRG